jgi:hypothetical protein
LQKPNNLPCSGRRDALIFITLQSFDNFHNQVISLSDPRFIGMLEFGSSHSSMVQINSQT